MATVAEAHRDRQLGQKTIVLDRNQSRHDDGGINLAVEPVMRSARTAGHDRYHQRSGGGAVYPQKDQQYTPKIQGHRRNAANHDRVPADLLPHQRTTQHRVDR